MGFHVRIWAEPLEFLFYLCHIHAPFFNMTPAPEKANGKPQDAAIDGLRIKARWIGKRAVIYCIRNDPNGKCYVGSSSNIGQRLKGHLKMLMAGKHHSRELQDAWTEAGPSAFTFVMVSEVEPTLLKTEEAVQVVRLKGYPDGYNRTPDGIGVIPKSKTMGARNDKTFKDPLLKLANALMASRKR